MMNHWFVDSEANFLTSWQEAFPDAQFLDRSAARASLINETGLIWWRLRAGESAESQFMDTFAGEGRHFILMCDLPDDEMSIKAFVLGASGCCNTYAAPQVLRQIAAVVGNGGLWIGKSLLSNLVKRTTALLERRVSDIQDGSGMRILSDREAQVAKFVAQGANNREIAQALQISERTVKAHLSAIFEKLGVRDRLQLSLRVNGLEI